MPVVVWCGSGGSDGLDADLASGVDIDVQVMALQQCHAHERVCISRFDRMRASSAGGS